MRALTWVAWLLAALIVLSAARNPLYLALLLLCLAIVAAAYASPPEVNQAQIPLGPALLIIPFSAVLNGLISPYGDTVLLRLPALLGGPVSLEALAYGAINGMVLYGFLAAFACLGRALSVDRLIGLAPRAFYPLAVAASIAFTFVPATLRQATQIREAQAIRGRRLRGLADWLPLLMPLLAGGLERALQLAETMTARGFATQAPAHSPGAPRPAMLAGLLLLLGGWLARLADSASPAGLSLLLSGVALVGAGLWAAGRSAAHTVYRREAWGWLDLLSLGGLALTLALLFLPGLGGGRLGYEPYPRLGLPPFDPLTGAALLGLLLPALGARRSAS
jgi:energy-coupling factor transport system permease protein